MYELFFLSILKSQEWEAYIILNSNQNKTTWQKITSTAEQEEKKKELLGTLHYKLQMVRTQVLEALNLRTVCLWLLDYVDYINGHFHQLLP